MTLELLRLSDRLVQVGPVEPSRVLQSILDVPGSRLIEDAIGGQHLQIPRSMWSLACVSSFCDEHCIDRPRWDRGEPSVVGVGLREYQIDGVRWLLYAGGGILADSMGLGKTAMAAVAAEQLRSDSSAPIVIIGPKFLKRTWHDELVRIGAIKHNHEFHALEGLSLDLTKWSNDAKYIFLHYDIVPVWWNWLWPLKPAATIVDEAHYLKNGRTKRARGVAQTVSMCPNRILLTGTPILNRVGEFWNLLDLAEGKWSFGTPKAFRRRYAGSTFNGYGYRDGLTPTNTEELRERTKLCYLRRTVDDVGLEVPPLTRSVITVPLDPDLRATHAGYYADVDPQQLVEAIVKRRASAQTLRLLGAIRKFTSRAKLRTTIARVKAHLEACEDVLVFCWERATADTINAAVEMFGGGAPTAIHGGLSQDHRDALIARFQQDGGCLVATLASLSVGVNLQRARIVVIHDLDWTPAVLLQAEGRVWRQGQTRPVVSEWMVVENSLDSYLVEHLIQKGAIISAALEDTQAETLADILAPEDNFQSRFAEQISTWRVSQGGT